MIVEHVVDQAPRLGHPGSPAGDVDRLERGRLLDPLGGRESQRLQDDQVIHVQHHVVGKLQRLAGAQAAHVEDVLRVAVQNRADSFQNRTVAADQHGQRAGVGSRTRPAHRRVEDRRPGTGDRGTEFPHRRGRDAAVHENGLALAEMHFHLAHDLTHLGIVHDADADDVAALGDPCAAVDEQRSRALERRRGSGPRIVDHQRQTRTRNQQRHPTAHVAETDEPHACR